MLRGYLPEHHPSHVSAKPKLKFNQYFSWNYPCTIQTDLSDHLGEHGRALSSEPCLLRSFLHTKKLQTLPGPFQAAGCHLHYCIQWFQIDLVPFTTCKPFDFGFFINLKIVQQTWRTVHVWPSGSRMGANPLLRGRQPRFSAVQDLLREQCWVLFCCKRIFARYSVHSLCPQLRLRPIIILQMQEGTVLAESLAQLKAAKM